MIKRIESGPGVKELSDYLRICVVLLKATFSTVIVCKIQICLEIWKCRTFFSSTIAALVSKTIIPFSHINIRGAYHTHITRSLFHVVFFTYVVNICNGPIHNWFYY